MAHISPGDVCLRCGATERLTIDHVIPKAKGGTRSDDNVQVLCAACNVWKATRVLDYRAVDMTKCLAKKPSARQWWKDQEARDAGRELWLAFHKAGRYRRRLPRTLTIEVSA